MAISCRDAQFGELLLFLSLVHLSDVYNKLLVFLWHEAGHDIIATLPNQPLQYDTSLQSEVTACVFTPAQDILHLQLHVYVHDRIYPSEGTTLV